MQYTVKSFAATGMSNETYGAEYIVHFNEDEREVKTSKKKQPQVGDIFDGEIKSNKYGSYFKTTPRDFVQGQTQARPSTPAPESTSVTPKKEWVDHSDGQRQGMCINNAAAFVNATVDPTKKPMTPEEWASDVHSYASALYAKGELTDPAIEDAKALFS